MITAVVGANWGDEGKGKITDMLAADADIVVRYQGGANAGHTIKNEHGKFALHMLPSGVFSPNALNIVGNGVALDIRQLAKELAELKERGVPAPNLMISNRAHIMAPWHKLLDQYEEERLAGRGYGSTKSGIAPHYSDRSAKIGIQVCELFCDDILEERVRNILSIKNVLFSNLYGKPALELGAMMDELLEQRALIYGMVGDIHKTLRRALAEGKSILLEGQLGAMKDVENGIYPMVTSSSTLAAFGAIGAGGLPPYEIKRIIAVVKAYSSAVGGGAFISELHGDEAQELRSRGADGGEYGATTGRPRRVGWFDAVASRYGCELQGATEAVVTILDALSYLDRIPVCVGYEIDGAVTRDFPAGPELARAKPSWKELPGWKSDIRNIRSYSGLPKEARDYVDFIESEIGAPVTMVSNGPGRGDIIPRKP